MRSTMCKLAALTLLCVAIIGTGAAVHRPNAQQAVAEGGQWGQKGGKGVC